MNLIDSAIAFFNPVAGVRRAAARASIAAMKRQQASMNYDAAGRGRRGMKNKGDPSAKTVSRANMLILRRNMRNLARNNSIIKSAISAKTAHTIGTGIRPNIVPAKNSKAAKNRANDVQQQINNWCSSTGADLYGRTTFYGLQNLAFKTMISSGECLIIRQQTEAPETGIPLQLKILEGDHLDHTKNGKNADNGNNTIDGVEVDRDEKAVAYWIFTEHPGDIGLYRGHNLTSTRIAAKDVIHMYETERPGQMRGLPRGLASAQKARSLDEYQDARLEQMKVAACMVGAITDNSIGPSGKTEEQADDLLPDELEPGLLLKLGRGQGFAFNQPPSVSGQHEFVTEQLHDIAADWDITYQALTQDLKQVNFTSGRMGWLDMYRKVDTDRQLIIIPQLLNRVWAWLAEALELTGRPVRDMRCQWIPPRREMFDPTKEIPPLIKAIRAGLKPMQRALIEQGDDPDEIVQQFADWNTQLDALNLIFDTDPRRVSGAGNTNPVPENTDDDQDPE